MLLPGASVEVELDGIQGLHPFAQAQLEVFVLEDALAFDDELVLEQRWRKALAPDFGFEQARGGDREVGGFEAAVGFQRARAIGGCQQLVGDLRKQLAKAQSRFAQRHAGGHGVPAKAQQQARRALGHQIEGVAQVQAGDRTARALDLAAVAAGKGKHRAMQFLLDARGDDADDALVPVGVEQRHRGAPAASRQPSRQVGGRHRPWRAAQRLFLHARFDLAPLAIERVELLRDVHRPSLVVGDQAFDAQRHVGQAAGGVEARADHETEVDARRLRRVASGGAKNGAQAGRQPALPDALQALADEHAVVVVEFDDVGDGAERDQVEQRWRASVRFVRSPPRNQWRSRNSARSASIT
jgi:hypothetical protein